MNVHILIANPPAPCLFLTVVLPLEITAAGITVQYWTSDVPIAVWITVFWIAIIAINVSRSIEPLSIVTLPPDLKTDVLYFLPPPFQLFGTLGYAEEEFWSSCLKLLVVLMFVIAGIVFCCGGGPSGSAYDSYVGGKYWQDPGAFSNGFKGS